MQGFPARITLTWPVDERAVSHKIARRAYGSHEWVTVANVGGSAREHVDTSASLGETTEFRIRRELQIGKQTISAFGYIAVANTLAPVESRGGVLIVVERIVGDALQTELRRFANDLVGDGWEVQQIVVGRDDSPQAVREAIQAAVGANPTISTVVLFGHVPVPYSGDICPDGHPEHRGAWPADVYYADLEGNWTDTSVNCVSAELPSNRNVPGDGKFDQSTLARPVTLAVGRIDFADMPAFAPMTETGLLRRYLDRNHAYRHAQIDFDERGIVDDHFGDFNGDAFAVTAWRSFPPLVGSQNVVIEPWLNASRAKPSLLAYGCGPGSYTAASGVVCTADFTLTPSPALFTFLFGSYFGDWNAADSLLRAPLAAGALTSAWAGYPAWVPHPLGAGMTVGEMVRVTQNNGITGDYESAAEGLGQVHVALVGDPTLRLRPIPPPSHVTATRIVGGVRLTWQPSAATVAGYAVYCANTGAGPFESLSPGFITGTSFTARQNSNASAVYMVKAMRLEETSSGTYYNLSQGVFVEEALSTEG